MRGADVREREAMSRRVWLAEGLGLSMGLLEPIEQTPVQA